MVTSVAESRRPNVRSPMSEELNLDITELRRARQQNGGPNHEHNGQNGGPRSQARAQSSPVGGAGASATAPGESVRRPGEVINLWLLLETLLRRWTWLAIAAAVCAVVAFGLGLWVTS